VPYFRNIAKYYVERGPGTTGPRFDLANVYSYTHGSPEMSGNPHLERNLWVGQLHKSLFDEEEMAALLKQAGFGSFVFFCYSFPGDTNELPICMGFYASKAVLTKDQLKANAENFLKQFDDKKIRMKSLEWL